MIARKCDICGKLYEETKTKGRMCTPRMVVGVRNHYEVWEDCNGYDICTDCYEAIQDTIRRLKSNGKTGC